MLSWTHSETSHVDFVIRISARSVLWILNGFRVNMRKFVFSEELLVIQAWKTNCSRFELRSWLFHLVKTTIVIINVSISASTVWLVDDASVIMVLLSVVILRSTNGRTKSLMREVSKILAIRKHFSIEKDK